jgi:hypothetical protein
MTETTAPAWSEERGYACCGGYREHGYRCPHRVWPATATPEVKRQAVRAASIGPAHAEIEDLIPCHLDYQKRKRLTEILARVWDDGQGYDQVIAAQERDSAAPDHLG